MNNKQIRQAYEKEVGKFQRSPVEVEPLTPAKKKAWLYVIVFGLFLTSLFIAFALLMGG